MKWGLWGMALLAPMAAHASTVTVDARGADGKPITGAVVMVDLPRKPAGPVRFPWPMTIAQQNISFQPHVLIVPVGATVSFPNKDKVRHHVYSFSKPKKFELKLYGQDDARTVTFETPGLVALRCNIHDTMSGFIWVVDTPYAGQTDASGRLVLKDVPAGAVAVRLWHPAIHASDNILRQTVTVTPGDMTLALSVKR